MANFAQLDSENMVINVLVISNNELLDENGIEQESKGIVFCNTLSEGTWVQTSYNSSIRKNFAGIGYSYDKSRDAFIPPKPYASWVLNEETCKYEAPIKKPDDNNFYVWDESSISWVLTTLAVKP